MAALDAAEHATYSVAWIDSIAKGARLGRSLLFLGEHARHNELTEKCLDNRYLPIRDPKFSIPFDFPNFALNHLGVAAFNQLYFYAGERKARAPTLVAVDPYFFPLDGVANWNRMYGRRGFVQHQCVLPPATAEAGLAEILDRVARRGDASFLAVLKKLGKANGQISFPMDGFTLALDFPLTRGLLHFLDELDEIVVKAGGRLYLAKDARQSRLTFDAGYPTADSFRDFRRTLAPPGRLNSRLSQRLSL